MSLKILFVGDLHARATRPISRLDDDYVSTIMGKIAHVKRLSEDAECDIVIFAGDIVDRPDVPHSVVIRVIREFKKFKKPLYTICGNHDSYGYQGTTISSSALGVMFESGAIKRLDALEMKGVMIYGLHAHDKTVWTVPAGNGPKVLVAHKMLTNIAIPNAGCFLIDDIFKQTNADVILSGDIHTPHIVELGSKLFVNPGSLSRMSINDRDRAPQVAEVIVESDPDDTTVELHTIPGRPAEALFDLKNYSHRMASEAHSKEFVKSYAHVVISVKAETGKVGPALLEYLENNDLDAGFQDGIMSYYSKAENEVLGEIKD